VRHNNNERNNGNGFESQIDKLRIKFQQKELPTQRQIYEM
jgi:hypothetical protein